MFAIGFETEKIDDVDEADAEVGKRPRAKSRLPRALAVATSPALAMTRSDSSPSSLLCEKLYADTLGAMRVRGVDIEVLQVRLFVRDDHVDVIHPPQTTIGDAE